MRKEILFRLYLSIENLIRKAIHGSLKPAYRIFNSGLQLSHKQAGSIGAQGNVLGIS